MACLDMFNPEHQGLCTPMSPRISFSNDFIELTPPTTATLHQQQPAMASEHFEFSVSKYTMMPADELFFKGTLLPFKKTTLRDELLVDDAEEDLSVRPPKVPMKWKEFLGLKKSHIVNKKADKTGDGNEPMEAVAGDKGSMLKISEVKTVAEVMV